MKHTMKKLASSLLCAATLLSACMMPATAHAAPILGDAAYTEIAKTPGSNGCSSTQGFAVSDTYLYSVQINSRNTRAFINRIHKETGKMTPMRDSATRSTVFTNFTHANSMDYAKIGGQEYLFVLSNSKILVFEIDNTNLVAHGEYDVKWDGSSISPYAFSIYEISDTHIRLLFLLNNTLASGSIPVGEKAGDIDITVKGYVDVSAIPVEGGKLDCSQFLKQGICCDGDTVYVILTGNHVDETINHSLIVGYNLKKASTFYLNPLQPDKDRIIYIVSEEYPWLFEVEDIDISSDGKMYFNTNNWKIKWGSDYDAVCVLNDFQAESKASWVNPFADVQSDDWFHDDVQYVNIHGMMVGTSDTTFSPADPLERAQIVTALWRLDGSKKASKAAEFTDVAANQWYTDAIAWAAENKIVEGHGDGTFGTTDPVTREQVMAILFRYYRYTGHMQVIAPADPTHTCSDWAREYVLWAEVNGLLSGIGIDITDMTADADRAEIAAYLTRFSEKLLGK